jgi:N-methylhydantoinase A
VRIHSIGAGGGSIAWLDDVGALRVGPRSAGAAPGPASYGRGGEEPTVTDCDLVLGRLSPDQKLADFLTLDLDAARAAIRSRIAEPLGLTVEQAAEGVVEIVNAAMEGAIRVVLRERGNDPRDFALVAFGGAGPLHAVELAARLGIESVVCPLRPGTLSAQGLLASDLRQDFALTRVIRSDAPGAEESLLDALAALEALAADQLGNGFGAVARRIDRQLACDVRYLGQAYEVSVPLVPGPGMLDRATRDFHALHHRAYAFSNPDEPCELVTHRLFVTAELDRRPLAAGASGDGAPGAPARERTVIVRGERIACAELRRDSLRPGASVPAPCVIAQADATTFVPPGVTGTVAPTGDIVLTEIRPL